MTLRSATLKLSLTGSSLKLGEFLFWIFLGASVSFSLHKVALWFFKPVNSVNIDHLERSKNIEQKQLTMERLLGGGDVYATGLSAQDIQVIGLMAGSGRGVVTVSINNQPPRQLVMGVPSPDGLLFQGVLNDSIVISRGAISIQIPAHSARPGLTPAVKP